MMTALVQRFLIKHRKRLFRRLAHMPLILDVKPVKFCTCYQRRQPECHGFRPLFALLDHWVRRNMEELSAGIRATPISSSWSIGFSRSDRLNACMVRADTGEIVPTILASRCADNPDRPSAGFRGSTGFPARCPPPLASGIKAPRVKPRMAGLQRSREPGPRGTLVSRPQTHAHRL